MATQSTSVTLRAKTSVVVFVALVLLCIALIADALVRGRVDVALATLPAALFLVWAGFEVFALPRIRVSERGLTVVNVLRTTDATWPAISDVSIRYQTVVSLASGKRIRAWGGPTAAREGRDVPSNPGAEPAGAREPAHLQLEQWWTTHRGNTGEAVVTQTWRWPSVAVGCVLTLAIVVQLIVVL